MMRDRRGLTVTSSSQEAADAFDMAVEGVLGHRRDTGEHLTRALTLDPGFVPALALKGFAAKLLARRPHALAAAAAAQAARASLDERGGTSRERALVAALGAWCAGDMVEAADILREATEDNPLDALAVKLDHAVRFMLGDAAGMRCSLETILPSWSREVPDAGFIFGCHAFALEETGDYAAAERQGRLATTLEAGDIWGAHAVAHVMEMSGRPAAGIEWLEQFQARLPDCNNFSRHVAWHRALFHLEQGEIEPILPLYDGAIRDEATSDFRDVSNAVSLLWRLEAEGVDVGDRWRELADGAAGRVSEQGYAFAALHDLVALTADHRDADAAALVAEMRAARGDHTQGRVIAEIGLALAEGLVLIGRGEGGRAVDHLAGLTPAIRAIGGSHAQRDLFHKILIDAAIATGRFAEAERLIVERGQRRGHNPWAVSRLNGIEERRQAVA